MNTFLKEARRVYEHVIDKPDTYKTLRVVLGNESCDLDSAIGALVLGFLFHHEGIQNNSEKTAVLPLLNIPEEDFNLKTEVIYFLEANNICLSNVPIRGFRQCLCQSYRAVKHIPTEMFLCRNLLDLKKVGDAGALALNLVDHHVLPSYDENLKSSVESVTDHRPQDEKWPWDNIKDVCIQPVGSCCTLIAKKMIDTSPHLLTTEIAKLLLGPIVIDTVNLSPTAGRATPLDEEVVAALDKIVSVDRNQLFNDLIQAKGNIKSLTVSQVLRKDLKIVGGVPMAGAPVLIQNLAKRDDFEKAMQDFLRFRRNVPVAILFGVFVEGENVSRDLAIFSVDKEVRNAILEPLLEATDPALDLVEVIGHTVPNMRLFNQKNVRATRKHIAPIVKKTASGIDAIKNCGLE